MTVLVVGLFVSDQMGAFNGGFSGAAGFAAMSSGSSYYYSNEIGWQRGHGGGGAVAGGDDVMMMLVDDTEGSDNSRPVTTGPVRQACGSVLAMPSGCRQDREDCRQ